MTQLQEYLDKKRNALPLKLNIQYFAAEGDPAPKPDPAGDDPEPKGGGDDPKGEPTKPVEFTPEQQEKVNQIVQDRVKAEQKKAAEAVKESEKLAKMNATQKQEYELEQLKAKNAEYERQINLNNMSKEAAKMLSEKGISATTELLDVVTKETAEETKQMVSTFLGVVDSEVQKQVAEKLRGGAPKGTTSSNATGYMSMDEIQKVTDSVKRAELIRKYHMK